jgi:hypothetical protein
MKIIKKEKIIEHPLESEFDIEPGTTIAEVSEVVPAEVVQIVGYDAKDDEIEEKLEEIYAVAMSNVELVADEMDRVEGKYKARVGEVTATMLNVALGAVREKSLLKQHKDKLGVTAKAAGTPQTLNQNLIVADRNEILRSLMGNKDK